MHMIYDVNAVYLHTQTHNADGDCESVLWFWSSMLKRAFNFQSRAFIIRLYYYLFHSSLDYSLCRSHDTSLINSVHEDTQSEYTECPKMTYSIKFIHTTKFFTFQRPLFTFKTPHTPNATIHKTVTLENRNQS